MDIEWAERVSTGNAERASQLLPHAIDECNINAVKMLIKNKADVNLPDRFGDTPLHIAVKTRMQDMVKLLLDAGANVNATNNVNRTPLLKIVQYGHLECIQSLLEAGADTEIADRINNLTPLSLAVYFGCSEFLKILLQAGANINCNFIYEPQMLHGGDNEDSILMRQLLKMMSKTDCWHCCRPITVHTNAYIIDFVLSLDKINITKMLISTTKLL